MSAFDLGAVFDAAVDAGMLTEVTVVSGADVAQPFYADFLQAGSDILQNMAQAVDYGIEYRTADAPDLPKQTVVAIAGAQYALTRAGRPSDEAGFFSFAPLKRL
ncbi:hypothetical protein [Paraburkholderia caribensis]|uniref:hypothetical protein n=1 Tax=Paraburkholderia caribensis TaxID=75105 RepID=UPI00071F38FC|nr:hypothetical protein [Paraburkholderia caribensis]ALP62819.1 hypothetical protein AN416_09570 [Paraburkholderia caribensis]AUT51950.1 hypothetical protein C2L66_08830 [Paraburkholderia caribensis]